MLAGFIDGTNTMIEMNCMANATGFVPDIRGEAMVYLVI